MRAPLMLWIAISSRAAFACPQSTYVARVGTLSHGARCGEWIATSDASAVHASIAAVRVHDRSPADFDVTVRVQQLTPDPAALELRIPGGYVVMRDGRIGLYKSEAEWAEHGMDPLPGHRLTDAMVVRLRGHDDVVEAWVDGVHAETWTAQARPVTDMEVAIVGPGRRSARVMFSVLADTPK